MPRARPARARCAALPDLGANLLYPVPKKYSDSFDVGPLESAAMHDYVSRPLDTVHDARRPLNRRDVRLEVLPILPEDADQITHEGVVDGVGAAWSVPPDLLFLLLFLIG